MSTFFIDAISGLTTGAQQAGAMFEERRRLAREEKRQDAADKRATEKHELDKARTAQEMSIRGQQALSGFTEAERKDKEYQENENLRNLERQAKELGLSEKINDITSPEYKKAKEIQREIALIKSEIDLTSATETQGLQEITAEDRKASAIKNAAGAVSKWREFEVTNPDLAEKMKASGFDKHLKALEGAADFMPMLYGTSSRSLTASPQGSAKSYSGDMDAKDAITTLNTVSNMSAKMLDTVSKLQQENPAAMSDPAIKKIFNQATALMNDAAEQTNSLFQEGKFKVAGDMASISEKGMESHLDLLLQKFEDFQMTQSEFEADETRGRTSGIEFGPQPPLQGEEGFAEFQESTMGELELPEGYADHEPLKNPWTSPIDRTKTGGVMDIIRDEFQVSREGGWSQSYRSIEKILKEKLGDNPSGPEVRDMINKLFPPLRKMSTEDVLPQGS